MLTPPFFWAHSFIFSVLDIQMRITAPRARHTLWDNLDILVKRWSICFISLDIFSHMLNFCFYFFLSLLQIIWAYPILTLLAQKLNLIQIRCFLQPRIYLNFMTMFPIKCLIKSTLRGIFIRRRKILHYFDMPIHIESFLCNVTGCMIGIHWFAIVFSKGVVLGDVPWYV